MRPTRDLHYIQMAQLVAQRSTCLRRTVGCVLVNVRGHVLATGYNGRAAGLPHCNEIKHHTMFHLQLQQVDSYPHECTGAHAASGTDLDSCEAIHAEQNALLQCRNVYEIETCYVTVSPCVTCVKLLLNTTCERIVFAQPYAHNEQAQKLWVESVVSEKPRSWQQLKLGVELKSTHQP